MQLFFSPMETVGVERRQDTIPQGVKNVIIHTKGQIFKRVFFRPICLETYRCHCLASCVRIDWPGHDANTKGLEHNPLKIGFCAWQTKFKRQWLGSKYPWRAVTTHVIFQCLEFNAHSTPSRMTMPTHEKKKVYFQKKGGPSWFKDSRIYKHNRWPWGCFNPVQQVTDTVRNFFTSSLLQETSSHQSISRYPCGLVLHSIPLRTVWILFSSGEKKMIT